MMMIIRVASFHSEPNHGAEFAHKRPRVSEPAGPFGAHSNSLFVVGSRASDLESKFLIRAGIRGMDSDKQLKQLK